MIHHVFANRSNVGDWLSAQGIQKLLHPLPITEYLCDQPQCAETLERLESAAPSDVVVIGGGGLLMDYFEAFWRGLLRVWRGPLCLWGAGVCDMKFFDSRLPPALLRSIGERAAIRVVRDELTANALGGTAEIVLCPSLAAISREALPERPGLLHAASYEEERPDVYYRLREIGEQFAAATRRRFQETNNRNEAGRLSSLEAVLNLYRMSDRILSSRLHGCILAAAMGRPVVAVAQDRKVNGFMTAIGFGEWVCEPGEVDRVPILLEQLPAQGSAEKFVIDAVARNTAVADRVRQLHESAN